jgi:branched-chain amino acid transport system substrate-binding protein
MGSSAKTIKIGALWPLSGPIAKDGNDHLRAAKIATDMLNEAGGLWGGTKVELVSGDAVTPKAAMEEAERLITNEKVNIIMGTWSSSRGYTASSVAEKHKKIYWETACFGNEIMERGYKYIFHIGGLASDFGELSANYILEEIVPVLGKKPEDVKVATIYEDSLFGTTTSSFFVKRSMQLGFKVAMIESYSYKVLDLSSIIMRLRNAAPDVLYQLGYLNDTILFLRQARELDYNIKAYIGSTAAGDPSVLPILKSQINYLNVITRFCGGFYNGEYTVNLEKFKPKTVAALKEFFKRYTKKYNVTWDQVPPTALLGFNGAWILYNYVLPKAGSDDPDAVRKAALSLDEPFGTTPIGMGIKFAPPGHPHAGLNLNFTAGIFQWQDQKMYVVWPKEYRVRKPMLPMPSWKDRK